MKKQVYYKYNAEQREKLIDALMQSSQVFRKLLCEGGELASVRDALDILFDSEPSKE